MLSYLRIRGLALLDDVALELAPGLNVLTGETGAGKSIIIDALSLLRGARARPEVVREGEAAATVDAQFEIDASMTASLGELLNRHDLPTDGASLVLRRTVPRAGRGRVLVQAELSTVAVLASIGEQLVDICSQHEHHSLTRVSRHLELLDRYAGIEERVAAYGAEWDRWREGLGRLAELRAHTMEAVQRSEYLRFQIEELERVGPEPGEYDGLRRRVTVLRDASRWVEFAREAADLLYESDDAVADRLASLLERARRGTGESEYLFELEEQLATAHAACEEAARIAARFGAELDVDPSDFDRAEERLHELEGLRRKHGVDPDQLHDRLSSLRAELDALAHAEEHLAALEARVHELESKCRQLAQELHRSRKRSAAGLAAAIEAELGALHMDGAKLEVRVETSAAKELGPRGMDRCEFMFSANRGEPVAPLSKVASGGELSRVLLAIKGVLATGDRVATYVFDEIDAGVGGAVAESIGRRLKTASQNHQVLCITHLPQIAAFADAHFRVEKHMVQSRTVTRVVPLAGDQRVEELARMLGGAKIGKSARAHARELLVQARTGRQSHVRSGLSG